MKEKWTIELKSNVLKSSPVQRHTQLHVYKILALISGSKAWTIRKQNINRVTACKIKFVLPTQSQKK